MARRDDLAVLYDDGDKLSIWWRLGTIINRTGVDIGATSPRDAYAKLEVANDRHPIRELHIWGHGQAGRSLMGGKPLDLYRLFESVPECRLVWFRQCDTFKGQTGKRFAALAASLFGNAVGHTQVISAPLPWQQRGICGLRRGQVPWWTDTGQELWAVSALRMTVPPWAWRS